MKKLLLILITTAALSFQAQQNNADYTYLGEYTSNGTPLYLEAQNDVISYATLEMISNSLPESYPVPDFNPHYITK